MGLVDIKFNFPRMTQKFKQYTGRIGNLIAATLQTQRGMIFDSEGRYNGRRGWAPLSVRNGQILSDKGTLRKSIGPTNDGKTPKHNEGSIVRFSGNTITIGTNLMYARLMNDGTSKLPGGVLRPKNKSVLRFPDTKGGWIFSKYVRIPPRAYDDFTSKDRTELSKTVANFVAEVLNGKSR